MTGRQQATGCPHQELAVGWALHALEPAEEILVAEHLPECAECTEAVAEAELVGAVLGMSVPQAEPSAELEQRVLAVADTDQVPPPAATPPTPSEPPLPSVPAPAPAADLFSHTLRPPVGPPVGPPLGPPLGPPRRAPDPAPRQPGSPKPFCVPDLVKLLLVALLVLAVSAGIIFFLVP